MSGSGAAKQKLVILLVLLSPLILIIVQMLMGVILNSTSVPPPLASVTSKTFTFSDYRSERSDRALEEALNKLLPAGIPEAEVDSLLVSQAGAILHKHSHKLGESYSINYEHLIFHFYLLFKDCSPRWMILATYDASSHLQQLVVFPPGMSRCNL